MSAMDKIKKMLKGHEAQVSKGVDKAGDMIDDRTQGKYRDKVDMGQDKLKRQFGDERGQDGPPPPPIA